MRTLPSNERKTGSAPAAATGGMGPPPPARGPGLRLSPPARYTCNPKRAAPDKLSNPFLLSLPDIDRDESRAALSSDQKQDRFVAGGARCGDFRQNVARIVHRLVGDREHDVARLDAFVAGVAVGVDARHQHAVDRGIDVEIAPRLRCDGGKAESHRLRLAAAAQRLRAVPAVAVVVGGDTLIGTITDLGRDVLLFAVAKDREGRRNAGRQRRDMARQVARILDVAAIERDNDVALLEAGIRRGAVRHDLSDDGTLRIADVHGRRDVGRETLDVHAEIAAIDAAMGLELR